MDNYVYPNFGINVKRRAFVRGITVFFLLFAAISILYGVWGSTLTVKVPEDLTAVRLSGDLNGPFEHTVTDPEEVAAFARVLSGIGPLPKARPGREIYYGHRTIDITLMDGTGGELTYTFNDRGTLRVEGSAEYEFLYGRELEKLIWASIPDDTPGWISIRE